MALTQRVLERLTSGTKQCSRCSILRPLEAFSRNTRSGDGRHGWCKDCFRGWVKETGYRAVATAAARTRYRRSEKSRAARRAWASRKHKRDPVYRFKVKARGLTAAAIGVGVLIPRPCEDCGSTDVQAHHTDYSRPLEVRWLCVAHHRAVHR